MRIPNSYDLLVAPFLVLSALVPVAYFHVRWLDFKAAMSGLTPEQAAKLANSPELFAGGFPSRSSESLNSSIFHAYVFADKIGLPISPVWATMIFLEIFFFAAAIVISVRWIFPRTTWIMASIIALPMVAGSIATPDLASFKFPFYSWLYAFSHGLFLLIAASILNQKFILCAVLLVANFTIHPIMGLLAAIFGGACFLVQLMEKRAVDWKHVTIAVCIAASGCVPWFLWVSSRSTIGSGDVDPEIFIAVTKGLNFHWYPAFRGVFWERHENYLFPLLSTLALFAWSLNSRNAPGSTHSRQVGIGASVLMAVCAIGVMISQWSSDPWLIKLSLLRADTLVMLIAGVFILRALMFDLIKGDLIERALAGILLFLPFVSDNGLLPFPVLLRVSYAWLKHSLVKQEKKPAPGLIVATLILLAMALMMLVYWLFGAVDRHILDFLYIGINAYLLVAAATALVAVRWLDLSNVVNRSTAVLGAMATVVAIQSPDWDWLRDDARRTRAERMYNAQIWARENTRQGALFMVDPGLSYIWRDKSHRPTFGTAREWLLLSLLYNSDAALFEEGLERYRSLGLPDPAFLLEPTATRMTPILKELTTTVSERFYGMSSGDLRAVADQYNVDYVVFLTEQLLGESPLPVVYQNGYVTIGQVQR